MFANLQQIKGEKMKKLILGCVIGVSCCVPVVANTAHADSLQGALDALSKSYHELNAEGDEVKRVVFQQPRSPAGPSEAGPNRGRQTEYAEEHNEVTL